MSTYNLKCIVQMCCDTTVRVTKSGSVLPLYKISVLLKTGGAGVFIITRNINKIIKAPFKRFDR